MIYEPKIIDYTNWEQAELNLKDNWNKLEEIDQKAKDSEQILYRYIAHPYADGRAYYQIIKENKNSVRLRVCIGLGDDWVLPAWGEECSISKNEAKLFIKRRDGLKELFSKRG
jgi:hypothetical protein